MRNLVLAALLIALVASIHLKTNTTDNAAAANSTQPAANASQPAANDSKPAANSSKPAANDSKPAANDSKPAAANDSKPAANDSKPASNDSKSAANDSKPASNESKPAPAKNDSAPAAQDNKPAEKKIVHYFPFRFTDKEILIREQLEQENAFRAKHNAPALKKDSDLMNLAQIWADQLKIDGKLSHSSGAINGDYGENIYKASAYLKSDLQANKASWKADQEKYDLRPFTTTAGSEKWQSEEPNYDWENNKDSEDPNLPSGHFSAMVWKNVENVGFGFAWQKQANTDMYDYYVVALYSPTPRVIGEYEANVEPEEEEGSGSAEEEGSGNAEEDGDAAQAKANADIDEGVEADETQDGAAALAKANADIDEGVEADNSTAAPASA